jgi:hypothetical protein
MISFGRLAYMHFALSGIMIKLKNDLASYFGKSIISTEIL